MSEIIRLRDKGRLRESEKRDTVRLRDKEELLGKLERRVVLLIDGSDSMSDSKKRFATSGAVAFARSAVDKSYSVGVVGFATDARLICKPTRNLERLDKACGCWPVSGRTFIGAGLNAAVSLSLRLGDAIVVVTDGVCGQPAETLSVASAIKATGIEILAIGTDDADQSFLQQLASRPDLGLKVNLGELSTAISNASKLLKS